MITFNVTQNGPTEIINDIGGGYFLVKMSGTFDGAIVELQVDFGDDDFQPLILDNVKQNFSIVGVGFLMPLKAGARLRFLVSSAGASTDITIRVL
jgi:hypothetical protein